MIKIDGFDEKILRNLTNEGNLSNTELASRVGLSPSACLRRVQNLEKEGLIKGYKAIINKNMLGMGFLAYVAVGISEHNQKSQQAFEQAISKSKEVIECHNITGSFEYLLRVETRDLAAYKIFHTEILGNIAQVTSITTFVVMESAKDERA